MARGHANRARWAEHMAGTDQTCDAISLPTRARPNRVGGERLNFRQLSGELRKRKDRQPRPSRSSLTPSGHRPNRNPQRLGSYRRSWWRRAGALAQVLLQLCDVCHRGMKNFVCTLGLTYCSA